MIETECQTPGCKNKVLIEEGKKYFGILCSECSKPKTYSYCKICGSTDKTTKTGLCVPCHNDIHEMYESKER